MRYSPHAAWASLGISLLTFVVVVVVALQPAPEIVDVSGDLYAITTRIDDLQVEVDLVQEVLDGSNLGLGDDGLRDQLDALSGDTAAAAARAEDAAASAAAVERQLAEVQQQLQEICSELVDLTTDIPIYAPSVGC